MIHRRGIQNTVGYYLSARQPVACKNFAHYWLKIAIKEENIKIFRKTISCGALEVKKDSAKLKSDKIIWNFIFWKCGEKI